MQTGSVVFTLYVWGLQMDVGVLTTLVAVLYAASRQRMGQAVPGLLMAVMTSAVMVAAVCIAAPSRYASRWLRTQPTRFTLSGMTRCSPFS